MSINNMHEAKTHLSQLVEDAMAGKEAVTAKAGKPLVRRRRSMVIAGAGMQRRTVRRFRCAPAAASASPRSGASARLSACRPAVGPG